MMVRKKGMVVCFVTYIGMWQMRFRQVVADKAFVKLALGFFDLPLTINSTYGADASVVVQ